jgi:hypothetical protein
MGTGIINTALSDQLSALLDASSGSSDFWNNTLSAGITLMFTVGAIVFLGIIMLGGIQWITSGGDKASVEAARGRITSAIVGLVILLSVFALVIAVEYFFGVNLTSFDLEDIKI